MQLRITSRLCPHTYICKDERKMVIFNAEGKSDNSPRKALGVGRAVFLDGTPTF